MRDPGLFSRSDIAVLTAETNDDVLRLHIEHKADLILTSFGLPGLSCESLFSVIRQSRELRSVITVLICEDSPGHRERSARCGPDVVVTSLRDPSALSRKVQELLDVAPRRAYRVILNVVVEGTSGNRTFLCSSVDISATGLLIKAEENLGTTDRVVCSFYLPDGTKVGAHGAVVRTMPETGSKSNRYGVMFTDMNPASRKAIEAFINKTTRSDTGTAPSQ